MTSDKRTRPRDPNQAAKLVFDIVSGEVEDTISESKRHPEKFWVRTVPNPYKERESREEARRR